MIFRGLDEEIRTVVRGQTNIGHEGRQVRYSDMISKSTVMDYFVPRKGN